MRALAFFKKQGRNRPPPPTVPQDKEKQSKEADKMSPTNDSNVCSFQRAHARLLGALFLLSPRLTSAAPQSFKWTMTSRIFLHTFLDLVVFGGLGFWGTNASTYHIRQRPEHAYRERQILPNKTFVDCKRTFPTYSLLYASVAI
eukprot:409760-Amphidinium_carterae.1